MDREIEFRGKTTTKDEKHSFNNVWVYGDLITARDKCFIHPKSNPFKTEGELSKYLITHEVIPETVGQYTGKEDREGIKLYEGDILEPIIVDYDGENVIEEIMYITYKDGVFGIRSKLAWFEPLENILLEEIKKIGNIYDNPKLFAEDTKEQYAMKKIFEMNDEEFKKRVQKIWRHVHRRI